MALHERVLVHDDDLQNCQEFEHATRDKLDALVAYCTDEVRPALNNMEEDCNKTLDGVRLEVLQTKHALERTTEALERALKRISDMEEEQQWFLSTMRKTDGYNKKLKKEQENIKQRLRDLEDVADWSNTEDQDHLEQLMT